MNNSVYRDELIEKLNESYTFTNDISIVKRKFGPFTIIYSDTEGYHKVDVGDRGEILKDEKDYIISEICYVIFSDLAFNLSLRVEKKQNEDWRRELFKKELEILLSIGESYYQMGKKEIAEVLIRNPYFDELGE